MRASSINIRVLLTGIALGVLVIAGGVSTFALLHAGSVDTALYTITASLTNAGSDLDDVQIPFNISGAALIDDAFMASDALNAALHDGANDVPSMPPSARISLAAAVAFDGGSFTEYTSAATNATANDVPLLPASPAVDDAFYFAFDNPARIVTINLGQPGAGTWTLKWQYRAATGFVDLSDVDDRTSAFTASGLKTVSWKMPTGTDWITSSSTGSVVNAYWARAIVDTFTSITTQPQGTQSWYDNGQWWTWVEDLDTDDQQQLDLYLGGSTDLVTAHQLFPGTAGIVTTDAAALELGNAYSLAMEARLDFSAAGSSTYILNKTGAITIGVSGSSSAPAIGTELTGGGTSSGDVSGITVPATGEQIIIVASDGTNAATWVNAGGGMTSYGVQTITDTANNLTWASNSGLDYFEWIRLDTAAATVFDFDNTYTDFNVGTLTNTQAYTGALGLDN